MFLTSRYYYLASTHAMYLPDVSVKGLHHDHAPVLGIAGVAGDGEGDGQPCLDTRASNEPSRRLALSHLRHYSHYCNQSLTHSKYIDAKLGCQY